MTQPPRSLRAIADALRVRHAVLRARAVPLRGRLDPALLAVLAAGVLALGAAGWMAARVEDARGFLDPPALAEIDDPRILTDYRDPAAPIVDMVARGFRAFVGRSDGTIHRYDMRTGLFAEERLPGAPALAGPLSLLSSTCVGTRDCPDTASVFAVTETGGLAARDGAGWRTVIGDSAWIGADGSPVNLAEVTLWALSDDGRWLLASAGAQGLGLFDQSGSVWIPVAQQGIVADPAHLNFAHGQFWLGGAAGLETIDPRRPRERRAVPGAGAVLDLERTADGNLLMLQSTACPGGTCLSIVEALGPTDLRRLVGETAVSPGLSAAALSHAALQDGRAVVLGAAGVHVYDPRSRGWTVLEAGPVDAFHAGPEGRTILFAAGANVGRVNGGQLTWQAQAPDRVVQILPGGGNAVLALLRNGSVVDLARPVPEAIFPADIGPADIGPGDPSQILAAATVGGTVVLRRGGDLILHDPAARRWGVAAGLVPPAAGPDAHLLGTDRALWLVDARQGRVWEGVLDGAWPARTVAFRDAAPALGRLVSAQADGADLHLVDAEGVPLRLRAGGAVPEMRVGAAAPPGFRPVTATAATGALLFSDGQGIAAYDTAQRSWTEARQGPPGGVRDIDVARGSLLALSRAGVLHALGDGAWATVSGAPGGLALGSDQLTDAVQAGGSIFLGGAGRVVEYRPEARRATRVFANGAGEVRLAGAAGGEPVWISGRRLFQGDRQVSDPAERVVWAGRSPDGFLYAAEENGRLHAVLPVLPRQCLFRGAAAPGGTPVEARGLPDGRVFVATTGGLAIHEPQNRRWVRLAGAGVSEQARIEIVAGHLVVIEGAAARAVPLTDLPRPDSCDAGVARVPWVALPLARNLAHDAAGDRLLLLGRDGSVQAWRGTLQPILPAPGDAPSITELRRVRAVPGGLMFAAGDRVWAYDGQSRAWSSRAIRGGPASPDAIDLEVDAGTARVTLWDSAGQGYGGESRSGQITLRRLTLPGMPRPAQDPARIRDMAEDGQVVAILGDRVLEMFDRADLTRRTTVRLPEAGRGWHVARVEGGGALVLTDGPPDAPARLFVLAPAAAWAAGMADLAQVSFAYAPADDLDWRLSSDALWRIDRGLVLHRCDIAAGRVAPGDCQAITVPPERIEPDDLLAATSPGGGERLVLTDAAVLRIDEAWRVAERVSIPGATDDARFVSFGTAAFLWTGQGGDIWRFAERQAPERLLDGVLDLRTTTDGLAATGLDGLHLVPERGAPDSPKAGGLPLRAATVEVDGAVLGLGPDGRLRRHGPSEDPVSDAVLPDDALAVARGSAPDGAAPAAPGAVWAQHADGRVRVHWMGLCRPPAVDPGPAAVPMPAAREPPADPRATPLDAVAAAEGRAEGPPPPRTSTGPGTDPVAGVVPGEGAAVAAGTAVATPAPVPAPGPFPCPRVLDTGLSLAGDERLLQVRNLGEGAAVLTTRATHAFTAAMLHGGRQSGWSPAVSDNARALDEIRTRIRRIDGRPVLAPPQLRGSGGRFDVDQGPGMPRSLAGGRLVQAAPFALPWLAWDRAAQRVRFADGTALRPAEAIRDGRFLPDVPGRAAYLGGDDFALLNPHGLWYVRLGQEVRPIRIAPSGLPQDLAGGRFLFARDGIDARTGASVSDTGREAVTLGALRVTETLRGGGLEATYSVDGRDVSASGAQGFLFDRRMGITAHGGNPLLLTPLGLVRASALDPGIEVPPGTTAVDTEGEVALARGPDGWSRRSVQGWTASAPPWHDRLLAEGQGRRWERRAGVFGISAVTPADAHAVARQGLDFDSDRLRGLAADLRGIVAITGTGTIEAASLAALATLSPPLAPDPGVRAMDARDVAPGRPVLWADTPQGPRVWDRGARVWRAAGQGEDPWAFRLAVDSGDLRLAFRQGRPEPSVRVEDPGGAQRYAGFAWGQGQDMPFDRVRGFTVEGDRILLATDLGLRRLVWSGQGAAAVGLYSGAAARAAPLAFDRVGRPADDPTRLLATSGGACLELASADAAPVPCAVPGNLGARAVQSNSLWEWRKTDTEILGTYLDHTGRPLGPVRLGAEGRWPHDRLRRVAQCAGTVVELWADADVVAHAAADLPDRLQVLPGAEAFLCQGAAAELGQGARLAPGFLAAGGGTAWRLSGQGWQPDSHAAAILDRAAGAVPWEGGRLRLRIEGGRAVQEVRGLDDVWRAVPWAGDRPAIDRILGIAGTGATLNLLTPAGVLDWSAAGRRLDPDALILRTPGDRQALADCRPVRIEARDGSVQAVPPLPGNPVEILCKDGRIWRGDPAAAADVGVFAPARSDIRADRVLVQAGDWVWTRRVAAGGAESLSIAFRGEAVSLDGGRLSLDDYAGLAAPYSEHVEIVTQGAGWWRSPRHDLSLTAARRPLPGAGAQSATALHSDARDGAPRLCVQGRDAAIVDPSGGVARAPGCRDVRGADATYTWHMGPGGAAAEGLALNGLPLRRDLTGGRFGDLFVTGAPLADDRGRILAPTRAGVVVIGPDGPEGTFATSDAAFLSPDPAGLPLAIGAAGAMPLTGADRRPACGALADLPARLPAATRILRAHAVGPDAVEVLVATAEGDRLPLLVPCAAVQDALVWSLPLNVADRGRYRALGADMLAPRLLSFLDGSRLSLADPAGRGVSLAPSIPGEPRAQVAAPDGRAVLLATDRTLYRMDTDRVLSRIGAAGAAVMPGPSGPFAPADPPAPAPRAPSAAPVAVPPPAETPPPALPVPDDTVPVETSADEWRRLQQALRDRGLYSGAIDGIAGPGTRAALRAWQAQTGRPETGVLTARQKAELIPGAR